VNPQYLFGKSRALRRPVVTKLRSCRQIILLLDFDGTLAPIRRTPADARMPARMSKLLRLFAVHPNISVGIVTGRSLRDIRQKVSKHHVLLIANHGFEIFLDGVCWVHPWAERIMPLLHRLARTLKRRLLTVAGVLVENKRYTLAVHYRGVRQKDVRLVRETVYDLVLPFWREFKITRGKKVIEVRPNVPWSKGTAIQQVLTLLKREKEGCVIYTGDDATDEDAFEALRGNGITIVVGKKQRSKAMYWVRNPAEVWEFLATLGVTMSERTGQ
jgi:trehalose 6-phosphate phosphatase